jgi:hypothetical protein
MVPEKLHTNGLLLTYKKTKQLVETDQLETTKKIQNKQSEENYPIHCSTGINSRAVVIPDIH